jgi:hypothetical protein
LLDVVVQLNIDVRVDVVRLDAIDLDVGVRLDDIRLAAV